MNFFYDQKVRNILQHLIAKSDGFRFWWQERKNIDDRHAPKTTTSLIGRTYSSVTVVLTVQILGYKMDILWERCLPSFWNLRPSLSQLFRNMCSFCFTTTFTIHTCFLKKYHFHLGNSEYQTGLSKLLHWECMMDHWGHLLNINIIIDQDYIHSDLIRIQTSIFI